MSKKLFVGSLPFSIDENTLGGLFSQHGQVVSINIIKDKFTGQSRGFAFVEMNTEEEAQKALSALDGYSVEGRNLVVKEALPKPEYGQNKGGFQGRSKGGYSDRRNKRN